MTGVDLSAICETLRLTPLWRVAPDSTLAEAARRMTPRTFADGQTLIRQGESGRALHVITAGVVDVRVRTGDGGEAAVAQVFAGECVGEMSLLTGDPASADVVAVGQVETLALDARDFTAVVATDPALLRQFVQILSRRLTHADLTVGQARESEQDLTEFLREAEHWDADLTGKSPQVRAVRAAIDTAAKDEAPVLVSGEDGTGREHVARLVHSRSARSSELVIGVDCALIAETEWGDKLLGARGAPHGANRPLCYVEIAVGGSLVLKHLERLPEGVQERLARALDGAGLVRDVRVIATVGVEDEAATELVIPALRERFVHGIVVPPLRERKRDIPLLAEHMMRRHAARLGKDVERLDDQAIVRLVGYDYHIGNDRELDQAVERAVMLTEGDTVHAEAVFLGPPPPPRTGAFNLLAIPGLNLRRALQVLPRAVRVAVALFFAFILFVSFFGASDRSGNIATTLVWAVWWPTLVLSFFFAGRAWCAVCPMGLAATLTERLRTKRRRIPTWMKKHDVHLAMGGLFLIVFVEETTGMRHSPVATGLLLVAIFGGATITGFLYPRRTWCRHVCPLGGLAGVCSTSGLLELRPTFDVCSAKCKGHACFKGDEHVPGCPMFNHVMFVDSNQNCVLCMNCVQSCPNDSPQLNLRLPGREIWSGAAAKPGFGQIVLLLMGLLAAMCAVQFLERADVALLEAYRFPIVAGVLIAGAALPLLVARPLAAAAARRGPDESQRFWHRVAAFVPLITAGFVAYQLFYLPGFEWLSATLEYGADAGSASSLSVPLLDVVRFGVLCAGLLTTAVILWRADNPAPTEEEPCEVRRRRDPLTLTAIVGYWAMLLALMLAA